MSSSTTFVISDSIKCHICEHKFLSKNALKCHMRLHTGVKPYECPYCGERFRTSGHRKAHIYAIHPAVSETEIVKHDQQSTSHIRLVNFLLTFTYFEQATNISKNSSFFYVIK